MIASDDTRSTEAGHSDRGTPRSLQSSAWAVAHRPLALFFVIALAIGGTLAYLNLGRAEDPDLTIKVANVTAIWPAPASQEMLDQVADQIEEAGGAALASTGARTPCDAGLHGPAVSLRDETPPKGAGAVLPACARS